MAVKPKFYPVLTRDKGSKDHLRPAKRAAKNNIIYGNYRYWANYFNGTSIDNNWINVFGSQTIGVDSATYLNQPGHKVAIAKGVDQTGAYTREIRLLKSAAYSVHSESTISALFPARRWSDGYGQVYGASLDASPPPATLQSLKDIALARLKNRLSGYVGNAELAAPLAESREIHRLVRQINGVGMDTLKAMLAAKKSKGKSVTKLASQIWLGFAFGVNPLLKDIQTACDSILKYQTRQDQTTRVSGSANTEYSSYSKQLLGVVAYGVDMYNIHAAHHDLSVRIVAGLNLTTRSSASYSVSDHLGLKVGALPGTLWELTPFSWVVDYFSTVGPWLEDMFYTLPGTTIYVSQSTKYHCDTLSTGEFIPQSAASMKVSGNGGQSKNRYVSFNREKLSLLPSRALRIKSADEIAKSGVSKLLNLASVIAGHYGPNL